MGEGGDEIAVGVLCQALQGHGTASGIAGLNVYESTPSDTDTWRVSVCNPTDTPFGLTVDVVCVDLTP
jgi:hypothetical protein